MQSAADAQLRQLQVLRLRCTGRMRACNSLSSRRGGPQRFAALRTSKLCRIKPADDLQSAADAQLRQVQVLRLRCTGRMRACNSLSSRRGGPQRFAALRTSKLCRIKPADDLQSAADAQLRQVQMHLRLR